MKRGKCTLCHKTADLCDSHYMPKGTYKRNRAASLTSPHPVIFGKGQARQSSIQLRDHKFCKECEDRLNKGGERWVMKHIPEDDGATYPLQDMVKGAISTFRDGGLSLYAKNDIANIDLDRLIYFGISVFWRGTLYWPPTEMGVPHRLHLGRYEKFMRAFLLGKGELPNEISMTISVSTDTKVRAAALAPRPGVRIDCRSFWFHITGLTFLLYVGKDLSDNIMKTCAYHSGVLAQSETVSKGVWEHQKQIAKTLDLSHLKGMFEEIKQLRGKTQKTTT